MVLMNCQLVSSANRFVIVATSGDEQMATCGEEQSSLSLENQDVVEDTHKDQTIVATSGEIKDSISLER